MRATIDEQQGRIVQLEGERAGQEGIILRQATELEGLKACKEKCEDELKVNIEANEVQRRELEEQKQDIKTMRTEQNALLEDVEKLK
jgi:hypothetical protein